MIDRRMLLAGTAAAAAIPLAPKVSLAAAQPAGKQAPGVYRYKLGNYELTAINDGVWLRAIDNTFVKNADWGAVQQTLTGAFMATDKLPIPFTTLLVNTGSKLILIDTGTGAQLAPTAGTFSANLAAAGIDPKSIDTILISHFHPDHINGLKTKEDAVVFPNAEIMVPAPEWAFWMDDAKMNNAPEGLKGGFRNVRRVFGSIAKDVKQFEPGKEVAPGITSIAAYGHTPGHTAFAIASGDKSMLVLSDTTNHPALFVRNPEWQAIFDMDGAMAVQGYHFPFPASGYIAKSGSGYELVPVQWTATL